MVVNFIAREISRSASKLIYTPTLIKKICYDIIIKTRAMSTNLLIQKMTNQHI